MKNYKNIWEWIICKIAPKYREIKEETQQIKMKTWDLKKMSCSKEKPTYKLSELQKNRDQIINSIIKRNGIKDEHLGTNVEFDYDFLKNSIKEWDKLDYVFLLVITAVYIALLGVSKKMVNNGKEIHDSHSNKATAPQREKLGMNKIHENMPNDQMPKGHYGLENPNGGRPGGSAKINGISLNHRYIFGHDLFKPFEILKDLDKIPDVTPILGSKKLGALIKQFYHIFYDTFSETGIPVPGSTYFLNYITKNVVKSNDDFIKYFSIHIEDIITSSGIEGCIYIYHRFRQYKGNDIKRDFFDVLKDVSTIDLGRRTFKEYEMGLIAHSLIIWIQLNLPRSRGKINYTSIRYLVKDTVQYIRLNLKWNKEYKNLLISELQDIATFKIPKELKARFEKLCLQNDVEYNDDFLETYEKINEKLFASI